MNAFLFLQNRFDLYHILVLELAENTHLLKQLISLMGAHLINLSHEYPYFLTVTFFALPKRVVFLHRYDHLFRHTSSRCNKVNIIWKFQLKNILSIKKHLKINLISPRLLYSMLLEVNILNIYG